MTNVPEFLSTAALMANVVERAHVEALKVNARYRAMLVEGYDEETALEIALGEKDFDRYDCDGEVMR